MQDYPHFLVIIIFFSTNAFKHDDSKKIKEFIAQKI